MTPKTKLNILTVFCITLYIASFFLTPSITALGQVTACYILIKAAASLCLGFLLGVRCCIYLLSRRES